MPHGSRSAPVPARERAGYREHAHWLRYQQYFPGGLRVTEENAPSEHWWAWGDAAVHLDRVRRPEAPAKVLAVHGAALYGRMLAPYGRLPALEALEFLAPDLPGHGLTDPGSAALTYGTWQRCVRDLLDAESKADARPILLFGVGTGGRLAYDVAACAPDAVAGVVATTLLDPRRLAVRQSLAASPEVGRVAGTVQLLPGPLRGLPVPVRWLANVAAISNHAQFAADACADRLGGGGSLPLEFVRSYLHAGPPVEPERFRGPPVLLTQPAQDRWAPAALSLELFERITAPRRSVLLSDAGHVPVEEAGLAELDTAVRDFLDELGLR